jgi:RNA polymerase sigma-70 factor (ECF subfamily)
LVLTEDSSDEALMSEIAKGDEGALRLLAERHLARMLRLAEKTLGSTGDADDVVQEALLRIWRHAGRWQRQRSRLSTWIYTIVYRLCIDRLRRQPTLPLDEAMEIADAAPSAPETLSRSDELKRLSAAMEGLQPRQRAALTLFYYEDCSGEEAAAILDISLRAFWSLLHRSRQAVQTLMNDTTLLAKANPS